LNKNGNEAADTHAWKTSSSAGRFDRRQPQSNALRRGIRGAPSSAAWTRFGAGYIAKPTARRPAAALRRRLQPAAVTPGFIRIKAEFEPLAVQIHITLFY